MLTFSRPAKLLIGVLILFALLSICPVNNRIIKVSLLALLFVGWLLSLHLTQSRRVLFTTIRFAPLLVALAIFLPGRDFDRAALIKAYISSLESYEGVSYVWGGENRLGIDCSGLVRRPLITANLKQGLKTLNPRLLHHALSLWWYDASARELDNTYRNKTRRVRDLPSINEADPALFEPGDLAVTRSQVHVLVYVGDNTWMEADPGPLKVLRLKTPVLQNTWFSTPVRLIKWTELYPAT